MIKLYFDEELTEQLAYVDFGDVEVGESKKLTLYLHNDSGYEVTDLTYKCDDKYVVFKDSPIKLSPNEMAKVIMEWNPPLDLRKALETKITIKGIEVIKPKGKRRVDD